MSHNNVVLIEEINGYVLAGLDRYTIQTRLYMYISTHSLLVYSGHVTRMELEFCSFSLHYTTQSDVTVAGA